MTSQIIDSLKQARFDASESMNDIYHATGITQSTLSRIETGKLNPGMGLVQRLADHYGLVLVKKKIDGQPPVGL